MSGQALYVHWPFCVSKCPYCDFNSHVRARIDEAAWAEALLTEIRHWAQRISPAPPDSIFFGGGTPSLMAPETVAALLQGIAQCVGLAEDCEITLEANPSSVEAARFRDFRAAGVNRLSLGAQSFDDAVLRFLGRAHDARQALTAIETAREVFAHCSFDLIYAHPAQTPAAWRAELSRALAFAPEHMSLYQLTIEPNTGFAGAVRRGDWTPMDDDRAATLFELTQHICEAAGLPAYEISNHAAPGRESRHNLTYWRYGGWIGVGPGAHGRPILGDGQRLATANLRKPERWLAAVSGDGCGLEESRPLDAAEQAEEALLTGLRLAEGIDAVRFQRATGARLADSIDRGAAQDLAARGLIEWTQDQLRILPEGRLLLNAILLNLQPKTTSA